MDERLSFWYHVNATATGSSISLWKFFANKVCVNQDGVSWTNPLVATPSICIYIYIYLYIWIFLQGVK